jgi:hypothetical protein
MSLYLKNFHNSSSYHFSLANYRKTLLYTLAAFPLLFSNQECSAVPPRPIRAAVQALHLILQETLLDPLETLPYLPGTLSGLLETIHILLGSHLVRALEKVKKTR